MASSRETVLSALAALKPRLREAYGVRQIGVFGSVVRQEATSESDIDVLVEFERPVGLFKFMELEEFLTERLGRRVDLVSTKALKPRIGAHILAEVVNV